MTRKEIEEVAKHAAHVGLHAFHGFRSAHGPAQLVSRIPVIGPAAAAAVTVAATVKGAVDGFQSYDG